MKLVATETLAKNIMALGLNMETWLASTCSVSDFFPNTLLSRLLFTICLSSFTLLYGFENIFKDKTVNEQALILYGKPKTHHP